jgi:vacuolar-type H+-ATPase subunit F/Vma7
MSSADAPGVNARASRIAALGERERLRCFAFAGVHLAAAEDADAVRAAWRALPSDVGLVILTHAARAALSAELSQREERLWAVMPA